MKSRIGMHCIHVLSFTEGISSHLTQAAGITVAEYIGINALVMRFMKGVLRNRPSTPRYNCIWDVDVVLNMFRKQPFTEYLSLYDLTLRTVTLLALVSVQRGQSIHLLEIHDMTRTTDKCFSSS